ncbi:hypothetical protein H2200_007091 [Cladophialophora chaetospira]|uniref:Spindle pole body component n=1 Tax=Cladophialophora chaetospira TaxID=386627 RepID=A0AA38X7A6_9EURO|nr:hypothetical protein H2200_007091 [Cladophialophora chaetospira]
MLEPDQVDPFSLAAVQDIARLPLPRHATWDGFHFDQTLESGLLRLDETKSNELPALKANIFRLNLDDVLLPDLSTSTSTSDSDDDWFLSLDGDAIDGEVEDVWILPDIQKRRLPGQLAGWDNFLDAAHQEPSSGYISEAQSPVLYGILEANGQSPVRYAKQDVLLHAFFELSMGRESVLFNWQEKTRAFTPRWQNITTHGYSPTLVQNCFDEFSDMASRIKRLTSTVEALDKHQSRLSSSKVAFLAASRSILYSIHKHLCEASSSIRSLVQLRGKIAQIGVLIDVLDQCLEIPEAHPTRSFADPSLLRKAADASLRHPNLSDVLYLVVTRACRPLLAVLSEQVGLSMNQSTDSQQLAEDDTWEDLLEADIVAIIHEARQSLRLLKGHSSNSPLMTATVFRSTPLKRLDLGFEFQTICELQSRAAAYENAMKSLIVSAESSTSTSPIETPTSDSFEVSETLQHLSRFANPFRPEFNIFESQVHGGLELKEDDLYEKVAEYLQGQGSDEASLPLELEESLSLSITPLITAQHRLLSYSVLTLLLQDNSFLAHLTLQRNFHLLGNPFFSSRLSTALFDSDQISGEGQRRTGASTGLRLHARDSWPPAGSELRLILTTILSDSLNVQDRPLEDCISFAIRDMPLEELEKCRNVNSIHALDFLRLQYTAPNELLEAVITPEILDKYDRIFQHLLHNMRLQAVTQSLLRMAAFSEQGIMAIGPSHKVIVEMHNFISTIADYCHNTAIGTHWTRFEAVLTSAKSHLDSQRYEETLRAVTSLDHLRACHERTLDNILHALMLKQKQARPRQILEGIYNLILQFAVEQRHTDSEDTGKADMNSKSLQERFRAQVLQFIEALGSMKQTAKPVSERAGLEELENSAGDDVDMFECLLLRLDMSGYWARRKGRDAKMSVLPFDLL